MKTYTFGEHITEIKKRLLVTFIFFILAFIVCYVFREYIFELCLTPLLDILGIVSSKRVIYTSLQEAFFSYIKLSCFCALYLTIPIIFYQCYSFIVPGLLVNEKKMIALIFFCAPILFYIGSFFVFYFVMPRAWLFFLSYENNNLDIPLVLEPRISEYLDLIIQFTLAFGITFQLPVFMVILNILGMVKSEFLKKKRRLSIVIIFIVAAIFTPPDIFSQIALAIPLFLLYELSIILCNLTEKRGSKKC